MKVLKAIHSTFATGNVVEDISFVGYLVTMLSVGFYVLSLTATKGFILMWIALLSLLAVTTVIYALVQQEEE